MTSVDLPAAPSERIDAAAAEPARNDWTETVLTLLFTASAILFVSFLAVVTGLV